jgi:hypothetical protein
MKSSQDISDTSGQSNATLLLDVRSNQKDGAASSGMPAIAMSDVLAMLALLISFCSLVIAWKNHKSQSRASDATLADIAARTEPKLQVHDQTFLSSWQRGVRCPPDEICLYYSSVITNQGSSTVELVNIAIEACPASLMKGSQGRGVGFSFPVTEARYLRPGESTPLDMEITPGQMALTRGFYNVHDDLLVFFVAFTFKGEGGPIKAYRKEIYRIGLDGAIQSGPAGAHKGDNTSPVTFILTEHA